MQAIQYNSNPYAANFLYLLKMKVSVVFILILFALNGLSQTQRKTKIILIGTFHFNNPGRDVRKEPDFDILSEQSQMELGTITSKISSLHPSQFFVEWPYKEQPELDSLYQLYLAGNYFKSLDTQKGNYRFYSQNEIFQLAFFTAKKSGIGRIRGIDYNDAQFPYDSLLISMKLAGQTDLLEENENYDTPVPQKQLSKQGLIQKILGQNTAASRRKNSGWYIQVANRAGDSTNFVGAYLASEWFRRNLYMYAQLQKHTNARDRYVVLLLGAGHVAMMKKFIEEDNRFEILELKDVLK